MKFCCLTTCHRLNRIFQVYFFDFIASGKNLPMSVSSVFAIAFLLFHTSSALDSKNGVDVSKTLVWGPGLNTNFVVPVRYFFIQPVDLDGDK